MSLPKNEKSFHVSVEGETSGERYEGDFTCLCVPPIAIRNKIDRDELRETGDLNNVGVELFLRSKWLVNVQNRLMTWPDWWDGCRRGAALLDDNVLKELYEKCIEAEVEWRQSIKKVSPAPTVPQA
jgi:hypothetical protein